MKKPIQVYLDSSDFSVFADQAPEHKQTFNQLCKWVDEGYIEVRFSAIHVSEIAHMDPKFSDAAVRRATALARLCQGKCVRPFETICINGAALLFGVGSFPDYAFGNGTDWLPPTEAPDFISLVKQGVKKTLAPLPLTRQQKRALERRVVKNRKIRLPEGLQEPNVPSISKYPQNVQEIFKPEILQMRDEAIQERMLAVVCDVPTLIGWTMKETKSAKSLPLIVRDFGNTVFESMTKIRTEPLEELIDRLGPDRAEAQLREHLLSRHLDSVYFLQMVSDYSEKTKNAILVKKKHLDECAQRASEIALVDAFTFCAIEYVIYHSIKNRTRKLRKSDGVDIFHGSYIPYFDLFRADSHMASVFAPLGKRYGTTIVGKLNDISDEISRRLQS